MNMPAPSHGGGVITSAAEGDPSRNDDNLDDDFANGDNDDRGPASLSIVRRFAILHVDLVCDAETASIKERARHVLYYYHQDGERGNGQRRRRMRPSTTTAHRSSSSGYLGSGDGDACENGYSRDTDERGSAAEADPRRLSTTDDEDDDPGDDDVDNEDRPSSDPPPRTMETEMEMMEEAVRFSGFCLGLSGLADACKSTDGFRRASRGRRRQRGRDAASTSDDEGNPPRTAGPGPGRAPTMEGVVHLSDSTLVFVRLEEDFCGASDGCDDGPSPSSKSSSTTPLLAVAQFTRPPAFPPASSSRGRRGSSSSSSSASSSSRGRGRSHSHGHHGSRRRRKGRRKWWRSRSSSTGGSGGGRSSSSGSGGRSGTSSGRSGSGSGGGGRGAPVPPPGADPSAVRAAIERSHLLFRLFHGGGIRRRLLLRRLSSGATGDDEVGAAVCEGEEDDVIWTSLREDLRFHYDYFLRDMATSVGLNGVVDVGGGGRRRSGSRAASNATTSNYRSVLELVPPPPDQPAVRRGDLSEGMRYHRRGNHNHNRDQPHHRRRPRGGRWSPAGVGMSPNHRHCSRTPPQSPSPSPLLPPSPVPSPMPRDPQSPPDVDPTPPPLRAGLALGKIATEWMVEALSSGWWCAGPIIRDGGWAGGVAPTAEAGPPSPLLLGVSLFHRGQLLWSRAAVTVATSVSARDHPRPPPPIDVPTGDVASAIHSHMRSRSSSTTESPAGGTMSPLPHRRSAEPSSISPPPPPPQPPPSVAEELLASTSPSKFRGRAVVAVPGGVNNGGSSSMIANDGGVGVGVGGPLVGGGMGRGGEGGWTPTYLPPPSPRPRGRGGRMVVDDTIAIPSFGEVWMPRVYLPNDAPSEPDEDEDQCDRDRCGRDRDDIRVVLLDAGNYFTALLYLDGGCLLGDVDVDATTFARHATTVDTDPNVVGASSSSPTDDYSEAPPPPPPSRPVSDLLTSAAEAVESALAPLVGGGGVDGTIDAPSSSYFHLSLPDAHDEPGLHVIYVDRGGGDDACAAAACRSAMTGNRHGLDPRGELARRMPPDVATALDDAIAEMRGAGAGDHDDDRGGGDDDDDDEDDESSSVLSSSVVVTREVCTSLPHSWVFGRSLVSRGSGGGGGVRRRREIYMLLDANRFVTIADVEGALRRARADLHWAV